MSDASAINDPAGCVRKGRPVIRGGGGGAGAGAFNAEFGLVAGQSAARVRFFYRSRP